MNNAAFRSSNCSFLNLFQKYLHLLQKLVKMPC